MRKIAFEMTKARKHYAQPSIKVEDLEIQTILLGNSMDMKDDTIDDDERPEDIPSDIWGKPW